MIEVLRCVAVSEPNLAEVLSLFEAAFETAQRNTTIARALAEGYRSGVSPPEVVLDAYFASFERDQARLTELRRQVRQLQGR